ncbi:MAG: Flp pilus assembly protein CpaB [Acidobacteriaceae bacterium]
MNKRKLSSAFLIALLVSGFCTFLLSRKMRVQGPASTPKQSYVAAATELEAGQLLKPKDLKLIEWPVSLPLQGAFLKPQDIVGRSILYPLAPGEPVLERDLAIPGSGLTVKIPDGMRAVALRSDDVVGVAGFLFPGSHLDVLVTYHTERSPEPTTATILQDAQVLAVGHEVQPTPDGKPTTVDVVTLLMDPTDAERVVLASTQGSIHFVLRNGADQAQVKDVPVGLSQLMPETEGKSTAVLRRAAKKKKPYVVETMMGEKLSATSFN